MIQSYLLLGEIVRPQGIAGEVKLKHFTDDPERFYDLTTAYRWQDGAYQPVTITGARLSQSDVFLTLEGVDDRNAAESLRGVKLYVDRGHARQLDDNQAFIADLIGARAVDSHGVELGVLRDVLKPGSADVFVFDTPRGSMMMPAIARVVKRMDAAAGVIELDEQTLPEVAMYEDEGKNDKPDED